MRDRPKELRQRPDHPSEIQSVRLQVAFADKRPPLRLLGWNTGELGGQHPRRILTADGEIEITRRYFWASGAKRGIYPVDQAAGIEQDTVSPGAKQILCRLWIHSQICLGLLCLGAILLDFYHLSQHVHQTAMCCWGEGPMAR